LLVTVDEPVEAQSGNGDGAQQSMEAFVAEAKAGDSAPVDDGPVSRGPSLGRQSPETTGD